MGKVILYTSETCHRCKIVKQMLDNNSVDYTEISDKEYILGLDIESVPAIEVDNKIISEYSSVLSWLRRNGYYSLEVDCDESN